MNYQFHLLTLDQIEKTYIRFAIADGIFKHAFHRSDEGYAFLMERIVHETRDLASSAIDNELYGDDLFKLELSIGLAKCAENKTITDLYGSVWFCRNGNFLKILNELEALYETN